MTNLISEKKAKINLEEPIPGSAFVQSTGNQYGHTGIVEDVYYDEYGNVESIDVVDSNYSLREKVGRRNIKAKDFKAKKILGFAIPTGKSSKSNATTTPTPTTKQQASGKAEADFSTQSNNEFDSIFNSLSDGGSDNLDELLSL